MKYDVFVRGIKWSQNQREQWNINVNNKCVKKKLEVYTKGGKKITQVRLPIRSLFQISQYCLKKTNRWHILENFFVQHHTGVVVKWKTFLLNILREKSSKAERWRLVWNPRRRETARFTLKIQMKCIKFTHWTSKQIFTIPFSFLCVYQVRFIAKRETDFAFCFRH